MKNLKELLIIFIYLLIASNLFASSSISDSIIEILKKNEAVKYSFKEPYGKGVKAVYLGYDKDDQIIISIAARPTKTYKKVMTILSMKPSNEKFKVIDAIILNETKLKDKYKDKIKQALSEIKGKEYKIPQESKQIIDAVSGATKHYKAVGISCSLMVSKLINEMNKKPDWKKEVVPK